MKIVLLLAFYAMPRLLSAATVSGTVKDSSGALVAHAHVEISGPLLSAPVMLESDAQGRFSSPELQPGSYSIKANAGGFQEFTQNIELSAAGAQLSVQLTLATARQEITVEGKLSQYANNDPFYRQLRGIGVGTSIAVQGFTVSNDVATFKFDHGTFTFLSPVKGTVTGAIFVGQGHFSLKAITPSDQRELMRRARAETVQEDFTEVVFRFTGRTHLSFLQASKGEAPTPPEAMSVLAKWQESVRHRHEVPAGFTDSILNGEDMENVDAEILAALYNPSSHGLFSAYIRGVKHKDLRFVTRIRGGAIPQLGSPEEVALINFDPGSLDDGIWYLSHQTFEYTARTASSDEERRYVSAHKYKIETVIGGNDHLTSLATITFEPLIAGERVIRLQLLPNLRVSRVTGAGGKDIPFIQESRKADGSFYAILPEAAELGKESSLTVEYAGDKVITKAGTGSFYIGAREAWYPNLNGFSERSLFDLTFKVPKKYRVISVGSLDKEWVEENYSASHWVTSTPVAVAGFNYGDYHRTDMTDDKTGYKISGYFLPELPDMLKPYTERLPGMSPGGMTKYALEQTRAQLQLCTYYFGKTQFDHIDITEQPNFNFGQSWPNLVYLPIVAYIDSTQRWMLFGRIQNGLTAFVDEVTPHEVAHQWWGHTVSWASYHDQWLSEGFAEFSAGLFLQQALKDSDKDYIQFWERHRKHILEKNQFGVPPNDAGPLWMGLRLISPRSDNAYQNVTYSKGAYVLSMLRSLMYTNKDHDKVFIEMMHDFVDSHRDRPASSESFKAIVEKHMTPVMDLQGNKRMDWFFDEWVYGTAVPRYQFDYQLSPGADGKPKLHMSITQSEVDEKFAMQAPIFADFGHGIVRLGQLPVVGNSTKTFDIDLPAQPKKVMFNALKEILER